MRTERKHYRIEVPQTFTCTMPANLALARLKAAKELNGISFHILKMTNNGEEPVRLECETYVTNLDDLEVFNGRLSTMGANIVPHRKTKRSG